MAPASGSGWGGFGGCSSPPMLGGSAMLLRLALLLPGCCGGRCEERVFLGRFDRGSLGGCAAAAGRLPNPVCERVRLVGGELTTGAATVRPGFGRIASPLRLAEAGSAAVADVPTGAAGTVAADDEPAGAACVL
jgi:hypothetical protein